jgi:transcriptional regulator with XRE-family HTH domain
MGIADKIANAKKTNWITEGMAEADVKTTVELAKISAKIERCRLEKGMTQKEFADYMGVTQGMVSKWESREYNFTIKTLNEICYKLNITMDINMDKPCIQNDYIVIRWDEEKESKVDRNAWMHNIDIKGAIA